MMNYLFKSKVLLLLSLVAAQGITPLAQASVPPATKDSLKSMLLDASRKKIAHDKLWLQVANKYKDNAVPGLLELLSDESEGDGVRWTSLFGVARLTGKKSYGLLRKYSVHKNWILRDASLRAMAALDAKDLRSNIEHALNDKALVVRTTAVDVIGHINLKKSAPALLSTLSDPQNFRRNKPLWIHDHVLAVLKKWRYEKAVSPLTDLLSKHKDEPYRLKLISALETITGKSFNGKSTQEQVYLWKRHATSEKTF